MPGKFKYIGVMCVDCEISDAKVKTRCRTCYGKFAWKRDKEKRKARRDTRIKNDPLHKTKIRARVEANRPAIKRYLRNRELQKEFGMDIEQYELIFANQNHCCAICKMPPSKKSLSVDHCHTTGKVRGLLCHKCNSAVGLVDDSPEISFILCDYLDYWRKNSNPIATANVNELTTRRKRKTKHGFKRK